MYLLLLLFQHGSVQFVMVFLATDNPMLFVKTYFFFIDVLIRNYIYLCTCFHFYFNNFTILGIITYDVVIAVLKIRRTLTTLQMF